MAKYHPRAFGGPVPYGPVVTSATEMVQVLERIALVEHWTIYVTWITRDMTVSFITRDMTTTWESHT